MKCIDMFFEVREEMNQAFCSEDLDKIKEKFPEWIWRQCRSYAEMTSQERELARDIPALDQSLKMSCNWPEKYTDIRQYKGMIVVVTHELSRTGAPLVLLDTVRLLKEKGYLVVLFSPDDGVLKEAFLQAEVPVIIGEYLKWLDKTEENQECLSFWKRFEAMASSADLLFCNTVVTYQVIKKFQGHQIPVLWWIHEGKMILDQVKKYLPVSLDSNIHSLFVSKYSMQAFQNSGLKYENSMIMPYGIKDVRLDKAAEVRKRRIFLTVGTISHIKAQDLLLQAIGLLDTELCEKCQFLFVGKMLDTEIYDQVCEAAKEMEYVEYREEADHETLMELMQNADCLICPSRDDTMPVVATEAFAMGKPVICSDHTGTAEYIEHGQNGFVFSSEDKEELASLISKVCGLEDEELEKIGKRARMIFESHFTEQMFAEAFMKNIRGKIQERLLEFPSDRADAEDFARCQQERLQKLDQMYSKLKTEKQRQGDEAYRDGLHLHNVINSLEADKKAVEEDKKALEEEKKSLEKEKRTLEEEKKNLEEKRDAMKIRVEELESELQAVYGSVSWKMTSPMRKAGDFYMKQKRRNDDKK